MERTNKKAENMVYTPNLHIPLGQAIKVSNGEYGLRIKKEKGAYEEISIGKLVSQIIQVADSFAQQKSSNPK